MICPILVNIDGNKSEFERCIEKDCFFYNEDRGTCAVINLENVLDELRKLVTRAPKSIISTLNKNTDELLFHQNETGRRINQIMEESSENVLKVNQEITKSLQENTKRLQNLGSTLYGLLSDQKDGRKMVLNQLGEIVRKAEETIQAIQQASIDSRTSLEQLHELLINTSEKQETSNKDIIETLSKLIKKNDEIVVTSEENTQSLSRNIKELIDLVGSGITQQQEFTSDLETNINRMMETTSQTREMIDRRLGEYLAAQRSFIATQVERSNEEVRLMSEVYKNNRKMLDFMLQAQEREEAEKKEQQLLDAKEHNRIGTEYFYKKAYEAAMYEFQFALELDPELIPAQINLALVSHRMGKTEKAIEKFNEIKEAHPERVEPCINLAYCYYSQKNYEKAIELFETAENIDNEKSEIYNGLGNAYYQLDKTQEAIESWQKAIELDPSVQLPKINLESFQV